MLGGSFQIGRSALASYQAAIAITGQNLANAANPDYARQSGRLAAQIGGPVVGGVVPGGGVTLDRLTRHVDDALEARLRNALGARDGAETLYYALSQTEALYGELSDQDVSTQLSEFFASFSQLQTNPSDGTGRDLILSSANTLVDSLGRIRSGLIQQVEDLNRDATSAANTVNEAADEIANLNEQIVAAESDGHTIAGTLRDRRDALLRDLGSMLDIQAVETKNGGVNVFVGSEPLVQFNRSRGITVDTELEDGLEIAHVRFADNMSEINVEGGKMYGMLAGRDLYVRDQLDRLDQLANAVIYEVNRLHSQGVGTVGYESMAAEYTVDNVGAALNTAAAGLSFPVENGTFIVHVRDQATGAVITRQIEVDLDGLNGDDTSLASLAVKFANVPGLTASVTNDNRLHIDAADGKEFWFSDDRSGSLAALGLGAFFTGTDAGTINVAQPVQNDVRLIAASLTGGSNDADNAGRIALLAASDATSSLLGSRTIEDFHLDMVGDLAVQAASALNTQESTDAIYSALYSQRESISGVSLDEEAINLTRYEAAYQGAARYLTVLDEMTNEVLSLL